MVRWKNVRPIPSLELAVVPSDRHVQAGANDGEPETPARGCEASRAGAGARLRDRDVLGQEEALTLGQGNAVQHLAHFCRQAGGRERFGKERQALFQDTVVHDGIGGPASMQKREWWSAPRYRNSSIHSSRTWREGRVTLSGSVASGASTMLSRSMKLGAWGLT